MFAFGENSWRTDESNVECFGRFVSRYIRCKSNTAFQEEMDVRDLNIFLWWTDEAMNSAVYQTNLEEECHLVREQWSKAQKQVHYNEWLKKNKKTAGFEIT